MALLLLVAGQTSLAPWAELLALGVFETQPEAAFSENQQMAPCSSQQIRRMDSFSASWAVGRLTAVTTPAPLDLNNLTLSQGI